MHAAEAGAAVLCSRSASQVTVCMNSEDSEFGKMKIVFILLSEASLKVYLTQESLHKNFEKQC